MPPNRQGDKGVDRPYYSERAGRAPAPARLDLPELKRLLQTFLAGLISDGYLQEYLGHKCVDLAFRAGVRGTDLKGELLLTLNKPHLWPFPDSIEGWSEDDVFDAIEFVHDNVSKPVKRHYHDWDNCGWHGDAFDRDLGKKEYREKGNRLLNAYDRGFSITDRGEVVALPDAGLAALLATPVPSEDEANVVARVDSAIRKFQHHRASLESQRDAVRDLVDVLEFLRRQVKTVLASKDEVDLFAIANGFGLRHHREGQKTSYDLAIWLPWMFQYYLATIHAVLRLIARSDAASS
jgi:hypothetical protein